MSASESGDIRRRILFKKKNLMNREIPTTFVADSIMNFKWFVFNLTLVLIMIKAVFSWYNCLTSYFCLFHFFLNRKN